MIHYFIDKAIKKAAKSRQKANEKPLYDDLNTIVILFNAIDSRHILKGKTGLMKDGKQVILWGTNHTKIGIGQSQGTILDDSDLTFWGFPKKEFWDEFVQLEADVIIDFSREYSPVLTYLMLSNKKIPVSIGFKDREEEYYDFICDTSCNEHIDVLFKDVQKFLEKQM